MVIIFQLNNSTNEQFDEVCIGERVGILECGLRPIGVYAPEGLRIAKWGLWPSARREWGMKAFRGSRNEKMVAHIGTIILLWKQNRLVTRREAWYPSTKGVPG